VKKKTYPTCENCNDTIETTMDSKYYFYSPECHAEYRDMELPENYQQAADEE